MKSIALCTKIHIPVIYYKQLIPEIKNTGKFINERQTRDHVEFLAENRLLPFLKSAENLLAQFGNRFKLAISISGVSIKMLEKYAPYILDELKLLVNNDAIEFFAEPWSNSILPWFLHNELKLQTNLHRRTIKAIFGQLPRVFMADLPLNTEIFNNLEPFTGCQTSFTCSNHLRKVHSNEDSTPKKMSQFLVHQALSHKLQYLASNKLKSNYSSSVAPFIRYIRKYTSLVRPLILVFDPLAKNISELSNWETSIALLLNKTKGSFYSLSDLEEIANYFSIDNNYSDDMLEQFKLPDYWLKNNMQKEVFKQFKNIYKTISATDSPYLPEAWDYLQDLNNFLYMSDSFFLEEFSNSNYSPFLSPHEAFTSYMNAIASFWISSHNNPKPNIKANSVIFPTIN